MLERKGAFADRQGGLRRVQAAAVVGSILSRRPRDKAGCGRRLPTVCRRRRPERVRLRWIGVAGAVESLMALNFTERQTLSAPSANFSGSAVHNPNRSRNLRMV